MKEQEMENTIFKEIAIETMKSKYEVNFRYELIIKYRISIRDIIKKNGYDIILKTKIKNSFKEYVEATSKLELLFSKTVEEGIELFNTLISNENIIIEYTEAYIEKIKQQYMENNPLLNAKEAETGLIMSNPEYQYLNKITYGMLKKSQTTDLFVNAIGIYNNNYTKLLRYGTEIGLSKQEINQNYNIITRNYRRKLVEE